MINRGFRYKLAPTAEQEILFRQFSGVCRLVYNLALEQRQTWGRAHRIGYVQQAADLTRLRAEYDWIAAVSQTCQQQALRDLDKAFANFFAKRGGYPTPRKKGFNDAFRFMGREVQIERVNRNWGRVRLPKIGWVRFRWTRAVEGRLFNATVSPDPLGWHISFACEIDQVAPDNIMLSVGIDRGVAHTLALSNGTFADMPMKSLRLLDRRVRKHSRALARCKRGSNRRTKVRADLAATKAKAARVRKHFNHVQSGRIAKAFGTVVIEELRTANMTRSARGSVEKPGRNVRAKAGLNRAILEQGWHQFATFLSYKLEANGGFLVSVPAAYTSQTCSGCGSISRYHRKSQAVFECSDCGCSANADHNAALNILRAGTRPAVREPVAAPSIRESRRAA